MDFESVEQFILSLDGAKKSRPFDEHVVVYTVDAPGKEDPEMFAIMEEGKTPVRISLKCDPKLSTLLREKYETVMPGNHLNQKIWNTVLLTGQLSWEEVQGLIRHSYILTTATN